MPHKLQIPIQKNLEPTDSKQLSVTIATWDAEQDLNGYIRS
jgi:hypothetical protein